MLPKQERTYLKTILAVIWGIALAFLCWRAISELMILHATGSYVSLDRGARTQSGLGVQRSEGFGYQVFENDVNASDAPSVLFIGDSFTVAMQVLPDQKFSSRVASLLKEEGLDARSINIGRAGEGAAKYVATAQTVYSAYKPACTVIQLGSDDFQNIFDENAEAYFQKNGAGFTAVLGQPPSAEIFHDPYPMSSLVDPDPTTLANRIVGKNFGSVLKEKASVLLSASTNSEPAPGAEVNENDSNASKVDIDPKTAEAIQWTVAELKKAYGDGLIITYIPQTSLIVKEAKGKMQVSFDSKDKESEVLQQACDAMGVTFLDGQQVLAKDFAKTSIPPFGFQNSVPGAGHMNAHGHAALSEALAPLVASKLEGAQAQ